MGAHMAVDGSVAGGVQCGKLALHERDVGLAPCVAAARRLLRGWVAGGRGVGEKLALPQREVRVPEPQKLHRQGRRWALERMAAAPTAAEEPDRRALARGRNHSEPQRSSASAGTTSNEQLKRFAMMPGSCAGL